jgi:cytochrome c oxidase subunit 2
MNVDLYEKLWLWAAAAIIVIFIGSQAFTYIGRSIQPPSHVETIDPATVFTDEEFGNPGVTIHEDGSATVVVQSFIFAFLPREIRVPRGVPVTFRLTSADLIHGFEIVGTNANTMVVPGYVSQFTTRFDHAGEYLIVCNEYCGLGHHDMFATLIVEEPAAAASAGSGNGR